MPPANATMASPRSMAEPRLNSEKSGFSKPAPAIVTRSRMGWCRGEEVLVTVVAHGVEEELDHGDVAVGGGGAGLVGRYADGLADGLAAVRVGDGDEPPGNLVSVEPSSMFEERAGGRVSMVEHLVALEVGHANHERAQLAVEGRGVVGEQISQKLILLLQRRADGHGASGRATAGRASSAKRAARRRARKRSEDRRTRHPWSRARIVVSARNARYLSNPRGEIFEQQDPAFDVSACSACHSSGAHGDAMRGSGTPGECARIPDATCGRLTTARNSGVLRRSLAQTCDATTPL